LLRFIMGETLTGTRLGDKTETLPVWSKNISELNTFTVNKMAKINYVNNPIYCA